MRYTAFLLGAIICMLSAAVIADTEFDKRLHDNYALVDIDLLGNTGKVAQINDFTYTKDVATFHFKEGRIHLLRYVMGRPTLVLFTGQGHADIDIPSHVERQSMFTVAKDSVISEDFEECLIRMADDLDLLLEEKFTFKDEQLSWRDFNVAKDKQCEFFFKPNIQHQYDNYFQLLRSAYERDAHGYFWIDFNRYQFNFDPNRPEQVRISYEHEGGHTVATDGAVFQRKDRNIYSDDAMSDMVYPTATLSKYGEIEMGGLDGMSVTGGYGGIRLLVNVDSLRFVSLFLHFNLKPDSIFFNDQPVGFHHRKDFRFIGILLPQYHYRGDTLDLKLWYRGKNFDCLFPYVENPQPALHEITFIVPKGFNYIVPDRSVTEPYDGKFEKFTVSTSRPYNTFCIQGYATGFDTLTVVSDLGISVNFLKSRHIKKGQNCFISDALYETTTLDAFNFYCSRIGGPVGTFVENVYPEGFLLTMPGMIKLPQLACVTEGSYTAVGGFHILAGNAVARQWYGALVQPASDRENWLSFAVPEYLSLLFIQNDLDGGEFYSNLVAKRDSIYTLHERIWDLPLVVGNRASQTIPINTIRINKGVWVLHMFRMMMFDTETGSDRSFLKFMHELTFLANSKKFTNTDILRLAEKHYGDKLDWFAQQWLYGVNYPSFDVEYSIEDRSGEFFVTVNVEARGVRDDFKMPVILRVGENDESVFVRQMIHGGKSSFELGPFAKKPKDFHFNEYFSVLSKDNVSKK